MTEPLRAVERPSDDEVEQLMRKYGRVRRRVVDWDLRHLDEENAGGPHRGEVVLLIRDEEDRLAVVRDPGQAEEASMIPMGSIGPEEGVEDAARRWALEETGHRVAIEEVAALHRVNLHFRTREVERWYFILLARMLDRGGDAEGGRDRRLAFVHLPSEMPVWWAQSEWFLWILKDGGLLHPHSFLLGKPGMEAGEDPEDTYAA